MVRLLDELGVDYIEGGWPGAHPKDDEFLPGRQGDQLERAQLVASGRPASTCRRSAIPNSRPSSTQRPISFASSASLGRHVIDALNTSLEEGVRMVAESIVPPRAGQAGLLRRRAFFDGSGAIRSTPIAWSRRRPVPGLSVWSSVTPTAATFPPISLGRWRPCPGARWGSTPR